MNQIKKLGSPQNLSLHFFLSNHTDLASKDIAASSNHHVNCAKIQIFREAYANLKCRRVPACHSSSRIGWLAYREPTGPEAKCLMPLICK
jgi:hypothetical protein